MHPNTLKLWSRPNTEIVDKQTTPNLLVEQDNKTAFSGQKFCRAAKADPNETTPIDVPVEKALVEIDPLECPALVLSACCMRKIEEHRYSVSSIVGSVDRHF